MSEQPKQSLGDLLRSAREARSYSRAKLAELTGLNPNSIAKYEKAGREGGQYPPLEKLVTLSYVLQIDPRIIFSATTQDNDEFMFFATLDDFMFNLNDTMEKFGGALMAVMAMAAKKDLEFGDEHSAFTGFLSKKYEEMEKEVKERGEDIASIFKQNGPGLIGPSRPENTSNNTEAVGAASTGQKKGKPDEAV